MSENKYFIFSRKFKPIEVTKDFFDTYYRDITAYRKKMQYHDRCCCPSNRWLYCDMDCGSCPYALGGDVVSLNCTFSDDEGNECEWIDKFTDSNECYDSFNIGKHSPGLEETVTNREYSQDIINYISEKMPELIEVGKLRMEGYKDVAIAEMLGIPNTTLRSRIEKMEKLVSKKYEFFEEIL